jgi:hypothetical protein
MSERQPTLGDYQESSFEYAPLALARSDAPQPVIDRELDAWGFDDTWLGAQPSTVAEEGYTYRRYQYDKLYFYVIALDEDESEVAPVEFRTYVNWVGDPPQALKDHIREVDNPRLRTLFDTGVYEGWMTGFNFAFYEAHTEDDRVAADEVNNLGVPQWEVLVYDRNNDVVGHAGGFFDPFALFKEVPQAEQWRLTKNEARNSYEIRPQGAARQRLRGKQKEVYLNGHFIGNTVPTRGTVWLSVDYSSADNTWKDTLTGQQMWSRAKYVDAGVAYQALAEGGAVYKVHENETRINLVAQRPPDWAPTPAEEVEPDEAVEMSLGETTEFDVRHDTGPKLGKYSPPTVRSIREETDDWGADPRGAP